MCTRDEGRHVCDRLVSCGKGNDEKLVEAVIVRVDCVIGVGNSHSVCVCVCLTRDRESEDVVQRILMTSMNEWKEEQDGL